MGERGYRLLRNPPELSPIHFPPPLRLPSPRLLRRQQGTSAPDPPGCLVRSAGCRPRHPPPYPAAAGPDPPSLWHPAGKPLSWSYGMRQLSIEDRVAESTSGSRPAAGQAAAEARQERRRYLLGSFLLERLSRMISTFCMVLRAGRGCQICDQDQGAGGCPLPSPVIRIRRPLLERLEFRHRYQRISGCDPQGTRRLSNSYPMAIGYPIGDRYRPGSG